MMTDTAIFFLVLTFLLALYAAIVGSYALWGQPSNAAVVPFIDRNNVCQNCVCPHCPDRREGY